MEVKIEAGSEVELQEGDGAEFGHVIGKAKRVFVSGGLEIGQADG